MAQEVSSIPRKFRRTANACVACRQSKIKCSGNEPCTNCQRRALKCRFVEGANRVVVTERYLRELQQQAADQRTPPPKRSVDEAFPSGVEDIREISAHDDREDSGDVIPDGGASNQSNLLALSNIDHTRSIWTSPFTLPSRTIKNMKNNRRRWIWLSPLSVWSFTARLNIMMTEALQLDLQYEAPNFLDGDVYPLEWMPSTAADPPDISGLPSIDHALYLFNTVKFHLGSYRLFDEDAFAASIRDFYQGDAVKKASESRLWFVEFLLVLAFGNAFLLQTRNTKECPGSKFFIRAMSLMPNHATLWKDSLQAIEVLALTGLYLYSIDHRESAHVYVAQALRIAQLEGLHTQLPEEELGAATVARCRTLWWTLYVLDRHFSSSLGLPMTTHDSDITTLVDPPTAGSHRDATLSLQVRLSHLLSTIITSVYKTEQTQLGTFLEKTRTILHTLAGHAQEIESIIHAKFQNSVETMTKGTQHVTLLYHQCVMVATRPLLLSVLKERLDKLDQGEEDWQNFLSPTKPLISTGIKSAVKTLQILTDEGALVEVFLPFDLEFTYGAAIHLLMANTLFPLVAEGHPSSQDAHALLDEMIHKGNRLAAGRKAELCHLETMFAELAARIERRGLQTLTLTSPDNLLPVLDHRTPSEERLIPTTGDEALAMSLTEDPETLSAGSLPQPPNNLGLLESIGISSYEFLSLLEQIGNPENFSTLDPEPGWKEGI